jgi:hypothetical protein
MHLSKQREGPNTHMPDGRNKHTWRKCTQICAATYVKNPEASTIEIYNYIYVYFNSFKCLSRSISIWYYM